MIANCIGPAMAEPSWHRYELARYAPEAAPPAIDSRDLEAGRKADLAAIERERKCIACLEGVVRRQPDNAQAHVHLAQSHLRLFDLLQSTGVNAMPLPQLRDAAVQSQFRTREELTAWLSRAVGDHWQHLEHALRHAREGLSLCPVEGKAYVYLGELAFLEGDRGAVEKTCVEQALRLRPFDGNVLYAVAMEALVAGDLEGYVQRLQRSYRSGRIHRQHVLRELVARAPEEALDWMAQFVIGTFAPSAEDLRFLHGVAAGRAGPEALVGPRRRLAAALQTAAEAARGPEAARMWTDACPCTP